MNQMPWRVCVCWTGKQCPRHPRLAYGHAVYMVAGEPARVVCRARLQR